MIATPAPNFADACREQVVAEIPFTVRRVARWSECDPAGVVYSGNFTDYLLSATHLFRRFVFGRDWSQIRQDLQVDLPAKAISLVFQGSLWPDNLFDIAMHVGQVRTRTFDLVAQAVRSGTTEPVFQGRLSVICVDAADRRISRPLPDDVTRTLHDVAKASPAPAGLLRI